MMTELSLNVLDVAENSIRAKASLVCITVTVDTGADLLTIIIEDDGCGMNEEEVARVQDPFFTTRTTRNVGLGIPFFQYAAESAGGHFQVKSEKGRGTTVTATFLLSHIDRMPLGDISATIHTLIVYHPDTDFLYTYSYNGASFTLDTRQFRQVLGDIPLNAPEVSGYIMEYLTENKLEADKGAVY
ncbi:MAG: ATP-binding protein [Roseburia sp.]